MTSQGRSVRDVIRSCDNCRHVKRACDGPERPDRVCTRCIRSSKECSYERTCRSRVAPKGYIQALETRIEKVEKILLRHVPEALLMQELGSLTMPHVRALSPSATFHQPLIVGAEQLKVAPLFQQGPSGLSERMASPSDAAALRCFGTLNSASRRRFAFWTVPQHEFRGEMLEDRFFTFSLPPPERLALLVRVYFETTNVFRPLLHRGLFEQQLVCADPARDKHFMAVALLVCALGEAQIAADEGRQVDDGETPGWHYFAQVEPFLRVPTPACSQILDVQMWYLSSLYLAHRPGINTCLTPFSVAIQLAYQAGAHRRASYRRQPNLMDELWKRMFWCCVVSDRLAASLLGRPHWIKDESFDLDLPLEVDDSRWDISAPGYPLLGPPVRESCAASFFNWQLRLYLILGVSFRTIYAINRSRLLMGYVGVEWDQRVTALLDGMLRQWLDTVPDDLGWNPDTADLTYFIKASQLHANMCTQRIVTHNPFMRTTAREFVRASQSESPTAWLDLSTSLVICTEAALACSDILETVLERYPRCFAFPGWWEQPFITGLVLLVNLFGWQTTLADAEAERLLRAVRVCLDTLSVISSRFKAAAREL
ncbi:fungal-specific transcription factor domain-containing protein [Auriculariales sp. MPI-PUGE-AT-0066]|nr:fungal-specific transcription factor domain-containing protein [Auriculariales sp. MPI-PUGE-AT-0066]